MTPEIGVPRLYDGPIEVLYPGERARAVVAPDNLAIRDDGTSVVTSAQWMVEPIPGWRGALLRWYYRLVGQYVDAVRFGIASKR